MEEFILDLQPCFQVQNDRILELGKSVECGTKRLKLLDKRLTAQKKYCAIPLSRLAEAAALEHESRESWSQILQERVNHLSHELTIIDQKIKNHDKTAALQRTRDGLSEKWSVFPADCRKMSSIGVLFSSSYLESLSSLEKVEKDVKSLLDGIRSHILQNNAHSPYFLHESGVKLQTFDDHEISDDSLTPDVGDPDSLSRRLERWLTQLEQFNNRIQKGRVSVQHIRMAEELSHLKRQLEEQYANYKDVDDIQWFQNEVDRITLEIHDLCRAEEEAKTSLKCPHCGNLSVLERRENVNTLKPIEAISNLEDISGCVEKIQKEKESRHATIKALKEAKRLLEKCRTLGNPPEVSDWDRENAKLASSVTIDFEKLLKQDLSRCELMKERFANCRTEFDKNRNSWTHASASLHTDEESESDSSVRGLLGLNNG